MEEKKHVCKHCNKRFQCGKSLGGHIRTHMMSEQHYSVNVNNNNAERNKSNANTTLLKRKRDLGSCDNDGNLIYGLRENPKKTTRFVHSNVVNNNNNNNNNSQLEKFCRECGKGFPSLKALCGHMACHSEKDKGRFFENNSGSVITEKQKLVVDDSSQSDTETSLPMKSTRSTRIKFKNLSSSSNNNCHSIPLLNAASSSVSEVENEEKEIIKVLVEMSKDTNFQGCPFTLVTDSSENNSVLLEEKSPSPMNYGIIVEEEEKKVKHKDVNFKSKYYNDDYDSDNSDSGYFLYGPKKLDSVDEVNFSKVGYFEYLDNDKRFDSRKGQRVNNDSLAQNLVGTSKRAKVGFSNGEKMKYESLTNEKFNGYDDSTYESDENSSDSDSFLATKAQNNNNNNNNNNGSKNVKVKKSKKGKGKKKLKSKKSKEHECPICNKIFKSGQALGGHKRSHFIGGYEENTLLIRPNAPLRAPTAPHVSLAVVAPPPCVIDLNLPAPDDE